MHGTQKITNDVRLPATSVSVARLRSDRTRADRLLAEECAVALVYDGTALAVVMATPADLSDLALGFSLTEGIIRTAGDIDGFETMAGPDGIELRIWLKPEPGRAFKARQRRLVGPTGCGLCGIESLSEAVRPVNRVDPEIFLTPGQIAHALDTLVGLQTLNRETRATHAAGFYVPGEGLIVCREDVGRHNALDKLAGALAALGIEGRTGAVVLTSRVSVELVQKAAAIGSGIIVAISAPTALAVRTAVAAGITLVGVARGREFEVFTHHTGIALY